MRIQTFSFFLLLTIVSFAWAANKINKLQIAPSSNSNRTDTKAASKFEAALLRVVENVLNRRVGFLLYTKKNPKDPQHLVLDDVDSVTQSNFNSSHPTTFTIHGWMSDPDQHVNTFLRDAYLKKGPHNVIVLDWIPASINWYEFSVRSVPYVGQKVGKFIDFMAANGWLKPEKLTLVGHSLGSHISGVAARSLTSGQVHTIVGLDPAQPGFSYDVSKHRLRESDAYYVETIQTTAGTLGYVEPIGKAAFYPNGGVVQPNCGLDLIKSCAHFRSYVYFAEAIRDGGFPSIECESSTDAINFNCGNDFSKTVRMGDPKNADRASGVFLVPIFPNPPYSFDSSTN